jgi:hypothetical protein
MPYSYLIEEGGQSVLMPGLSLRSYGTVRDIEKWKARDKRSLKRDNICFEEFNPYIMGKMLRGVDTLTRMLEDNPEAKSYNYNRTVIKAPMVERGIKLYNSAIVASLGAMLEGGDHRAASVDGSEWIDVAGEYMPLSVVEQVMSDIVTESLTLEQVAERFNNVMACYKDMAAAYAYDILCSLLGHQPGEQELREVIASSRSVRESMRAVTEADRMRDAGFDMMVGYGYDYRDEEEQKRDFLGSR